LLQFRVFVSVVCRPDEVQNSSKSTGNESRGGKTLHPSNYMPQRHKQMPASRHSADSGSGAGGMHEEWETASESSDVLKDSDSQQQSQSARADKHASARRDSRRGYSNQRHTQSRRGHYRDRAPADAGSGSIAGQHEVGSGSNANSASVAAATSGGRQNSFPASDPGGPGGNVHAVYRVDQVVVDNPAAIRTALSDVFMRCVSVVM